MPLVPNVQSWLERGLLPDPILRFGMRRLLARKLHDEGKNGVQYAQVNVMKLLSRMHSGPIAVSTQEANAQHYELPTEFFKLCLGRHLKYSSCYFRRGQESLDEAEADMLSITCERAALEDGQEILELGCGWGSLSLFMAERYPKAHIISVSNSRTQKAYINAQAQLRGLKNVEVITSDMNTFELGLKFDRVVSVEMFEHMRNWAKLLEKVASFLKGDGKLFLHIFTHRDHAYFYEHEDPNDFIGKYFFTGGVMPSDHLPLYFQDHFLIEDHWRVSGTHYARTANLWLANMDRHKDKIMPILQQTYGQTDAVKWWNYWRIFYMACAELWGYKNGSEWMVSHYRFRKRI